MQLVFADYEVLEQHANVKEIRIHITTPDPDTDQKGRSDAYVTFTDAVVNGWANQAAMWTAVSNELGRIYRRNSVKAKLDPFLNSSTTV